MASKRKLKKTLRFITYELITDVFFRSLISSEDITAKADALALEIIKLSEEYVGRANHCAGKENRNLVKKYYKKLYADWNVEAGEIITKIEEL